MALPIEKQEELINLTMRLAEETASQGNLPFAALLIDANGTVVLSAKNTVNSTNNAAAHAEINILFEAGKKLATNDLSSYSIVSNAASCPMCTSAAVKAKIKEFYYGAPNEETMVPNISMNQIIEATPFEIKVHGGILGRAAKEQIHRLARR